MLMRRKKQPQRAQAEEVPAQEEQPAAPTAPRYRCYLVTGVNVYCILVE